MIRGGLRVPVPEHAAIWNKTTGKIIACPYGSIGDRLWVKEAIRRTDVLVGTSGRDLVDYVADGAFCPYVDRWCWKSEKLSPIFMPWGARRLELAITDVRAERLHDISEDDARAELGTDEPNLLGELPLSAFKVVEGRPWARAYFLKWCEINGVMSWTENPLVWALTFKPEKRTDG